MQIFISISLVIALHWNSFGAENALALEDIFNESLSKRREARQHFDEILDSAPQSAMYLLSLAFEIVESQKENKTDEHYIKESTVSMLIRACGTKKKVLFTPLIIGFLQVSQSSHLRHACCFSLGEMRDPRSTSILLRTLGDSDATVRANAVNALISLKHYKFILDLPGLLTDDEPRLFWEASRAASQALNRPLPDNMSIDMEFHALSEKQILAIKDFASKLSREITKSKTPP